MVGLVVGASVFAAMEGAGEPSSLLVVGLNVGALVVVEFESEEAGEGAIVGTAVPSSSGISFVGASVVAGSADGSSVGSTSTVGARVGAGVSEVVGALVGENVGEKDGAAVGL
jgi:membrane protein DedA with SNARE-associated domain